jgi:hypothetical protein
MKSVCIALLASSVSAFAPSQQGPVKSALSYASELDSMTGTGIESPKVVCVWMYFLKGSCKCHVYLVLTIFISYQNA